MKHIKKFGTEEEYIAYIKSIEAASPNVCLIGDNVIRYNKVVYGRLPFFIEAKEDMTVKFSTNAIQYSLNNQSWVSLPKNTATPTINKGQVIYFKQTGISPSSSTGIGTFTLTGKCNCAGNIMSLLYGDDYFNEDNNLPDYAFYKLFSNATNIISAKNIILPKKSSLRSFAFMFESCSNLVDGPDILAETLANKSCEDMYVHCSSLAIHPEIAATTIDQYACGAMFYNCVLLQETCELKAKILTSGCYNYMYYGCRNLRLIKAYFTTSPSSSVTNNWVSGVASTGTFVKNAEATWDVTGVNGIPSGWTVETATE